MFSISNFNRGGLKAAPAILIAMLLLLVTLPVYAGENEPHGMINYRDGVLPLRATSELLGGRVDYDASRDLAVVTQPEKRSGR